jgi:hypothetical protein
VSNPQYTVDVFTEQQANSKFPENTYDCHTPEAVAKVVRDCSRKISGIKKIEVWINRYDETPS